MEFNGNKIIDEEDLFKVRECKRCSKSLEGKRKDAIYCSRNCKSISKRCIKSRQETINKWKESLKINIEFEKHLKSLNN